MVLRALRRRIYLREFLERFTAILLVTLGVYLVGALWLRFAAQQAPVSPTLLGLLALAALVLTGILVLSRPRSLRQVAQIIDRRARTKDRLLNALAWSESGAASHPFASLAAAECQAYLRDQDFRSSAPVAPPQFARWIVVPLVALGLVQLDFLAHDRDRRQSADQAQAAVSDTVRQLEEIARKAERAARELQSPEIQKLAEEIQRRAAELKSETKPEDAEKAAMKALSSLEETMRDLQRRPSPEEEMKTLAKALAGVPGMEKVLKELNENNLAAAQKALEEAREAQKEGGANSASEEQIKKALEDAVQNLSERRQLSDALQKLSESLSQNGQQSMSQKGLEQLQKLMQQAQQQGGSSQNGEGSGAQRQMTMQELLSALENAKFGEQQNGGGPKPDDRGGNGGQQVQIQNFGQGEGPGIPKNGEASAPTGLPGSERDFGTTANPFGPQNPAQDKGAELAVKGQLGEGETLSMSLPSAGDRSKSAKRYKDLYDSAAAAAQDTVQQENVPLGSRFLIQKYFESIRPKE